jgi:3-dehydrosphinganine reductase
VRVIAETVAWNDGNPPDTVWCVAGVAHPTLFVDTPVSVFHEQMDSNYFTSLHMAHATLTSWLKTAQGDNTDGGPSTALPARATPSDAPRSNHPRPARHLIFTASFAALYTFTGYTPYSPAKAALRSLSDTLSQEMNLYAGAHPNEPPVRLHTIFPATILSEGYEAENRIKPDLTKKLEEDDDGQTPEAIAIKSIKGLESGQELVATDILTELVKHSMLGGSLRGGVGRALLAWFLAGLMGLVMIFVRGDMDRKVTTWGRKFGTSGKKEADKHA